MASTSTNSSTSTSTSTTQPPVATYIIGTYDTGKTIELRQKSHNILLDKTLATETITVQVYDGSSWTNAGNITPDADWAWKTIDVSAILDTWAKINAAKMWLQCNTGV